MTRDELLRAWVEALESGKYSQTTGRLREAERYCCLGVLCDVSGVGEWREGAYETPDGIIRSFELPLAVAEFQGIGKGAFQSVLANQNDNGATFAEIARAIRDEFPDVFAPAGAA